MVEEGSYDVCVLGSCNMDLVAVTARMPGPGETVAGDRHWQVPGGKGLNQALAAARAGARVAMAGAVGDDAYGGELLGTLQAQGVDTTAVATVGEPTGTAHILVDHAGENRIVIVAGANGARSALTDADRSVIAASRMLLLQLEVRLALVAEAAAFARSVGTEVVLTPAPAQVLSRQLLADVDLLVPNEHELRLLVDEAETTTAADRLRAEGVGGVLVTLGAQGCCLVTADGVRRLSAPVVDVVDTTAAGDTFVGAYAAGKVAGTSVDETLRFATAAASLAVEHAGASTSMPDVAQILERLGRVGSVTA